ncbi:MAG TPA: glycosyltransferase family 39 protein [Candidatus Sulfotelmatobacter sp.]|nr:glycosyltransferase family 39 protein [Candidatus Sulfotelmatobacter sp.]
MTTEDHPVRTLVRPLPDRIGRALGRLYRFAVTPRGFAVLLAAYLSVHFALRLWASPNIGTDDVEQALFAQFWAWGYNPTQPPLFTWLLLGAYALFGTGILAHVVVKYVALGLTYGFAYGCARRLITSPTLAVLATLSLVLIYDFGWGVHTGVTHSLILSVAIFGTLLALLRLVERRRTLDYLVIGFAIGLGLLTKYSYGIFIVPLLGACLLEPSTRVGVLDRRMILALAVAAAIFLPHGIWMLAVGPNYRTTLATLGGVGAHPSWLANVATGIGSLIKASALFLAPFWLIALAVLRPAAGQPAAPARPWLRVLAWTLVIALSVLALTVLVAQVTYFKDRRMHAVLLTVPLLCFLWLDQRRPDERRLRWFAGAIGAVVLTALVALLGQALFEPYTCRRCWLHMPLPAFATAIRQAGFTRGTIVTADEHLGGNLRLAFPRSRVMTPAYSLLDPPPRGGEGCVLAWHAQIMGDALPPQLGAFVAGRFKLTPEGTPVVVELPMLRRPGRLDHFAYLIATNADGDCHPR